MWSRGRSLVTRTHYRFNIHGLFLLRVDRSTYTSRRHVCSQLDFTKSRRLTNQYRSIVLICDLIDRSSKNRMNGLSFWGGASENSRAGCLPGWLPIKWLKGHFLGSFPASDAGSHLLLSLQIMQQRVQYSRSILEMNSGARCLLPYGCKRTELPTSYCKYVFGPHGKFGGDQHFPETCATSPFNTSVPARLCGKSVPSTSLKSKIWNWVQAAVERSFHLQNLACFVCALCWLCWFEIKKSETFSIVVFSARLYEHFHIFNAYKPAFCNI